MNNHNNDRQRLENLIAGRTSGGRLAECCALRHQSVKKWKCPIWS